MLVHHLFGGFKCSVDFPDGAPEIFKRAVGRADGLFPVPLVHIQGVDIVKFLVGTDGVHVGVQSESGVDIVNPELHSFPLCKRVDDFGSAVAKRFHGESHRTLRAVQVIVKSRSGEHEKRSSDAPEIQRRGKFLLEILFDSLDGDFSRFGCELLSVVFWNYKWHKESISCLIVSFCFVKVINNFNNAKCPTLSVAEYAGLRLKLEYLN